MDAVADGLVAADSLENGVVVETRIDEQNSRGWPKAILAATVTGQGASGVGTWAVNDPNDPASVGPIIALNDVARTYSSWGAAAEPGSQMYENIQKMLGFEATAAAERCASGST